MQADSLTVLALMAGFVCMVALGSWVHLDDATRAEIHRSKGRLLAAAGAAGAVLAVLLSG
jgi:hypothetical protein